MSVESFKQEEIEAKKSIDILKTGDKVSVCRSSGEIEAGWVLDGFNQNTGNAIVRKQEGKNQLVKEISQIELYSINRSAGESKKFALGEWVKLWNSTESSLTHGVNITQQEKEIMMSPEEARVFLGLESSKAMKKGMTGDGGTFVSTDSLGERVIKLKKRIALFGETPEDQQKLQNLSGM